MSHTCHAHGCDKSVPPRMLFCRSHWFSLRKSTQDAIWREYRPGQERDKKPSFRYMAVQRFAVAEAAFKPNDEDAAKISGVYIAEAMLWRKRAIDAGLDDSLEGLIEEKRRVG